MKKFSSIEEWLDYRIKHKCYDAFYPTAILKQVDNITKEDVLNICVKYQNENKLLPLYEVRCPKCFNVLGKYETISDIPNEFEYCESCENENIKIESDNYFILFKIIR